MRKRIKLKAHVKSKCDCENHYLELCTFFDSLEKTYFKKCTKCGKVWTDVQKTYEVCEYNTETVKTIDGRIITLYRPVIKQVTDTMTPGKHIPGEIVCNTKVANQLFYVKPDGTLSMIYQGGDQT
jgi:hypothetical protein